MGTRLGTARSTLQSALQSTLENTARRTRLTKTVLVGATALAAGLTTPNAYAAGAQARNLPDTGLGDLLALALLAAGLLAAGFALTIGVQRADREEP
jgi:hypothetical protein